MLYWYHGSKPSILNRRLAVPAPASDSDPILSRAQGLERSLKNAGAVLVGFADLRPVTPRPFEHLLTGVALALPFDPDPALARNPGQGAANPDYVAAYGRNRLKIDPLVELGTNILRREGFRAEGYGYEIFGGQRGGDMNPALHLTAHYQHKTTARLAGLGWIGRMGVLVTRSWGPHIWLGTIFTDASLPPGTPLKPGCGSCRRCVEACPVQAIQGPVWQPGFQRADLLDIHKCQAHRRERGRETDLPMCGLCLAACPHQGPAL